MASHANLEYFYVIFFITHVLLPLSSTMSSNNKQAKRRLKQLGATLNPSKAGWSDSEDEDLIKQGTFFIKKLEMHNVLITK